MHRVFFAQASEKRVRVLLIGGARWVELRHGASWFVAIPSGQMKEQGLWPCSFMILREFTLAGARRMTGARQGGSVAQAFQTYGAVSVAAP